MRIFGLEIRRAPRPLSAFGRMCKAVDDLNAAWKSCQQEGSKVRPWVVWEQKQVILTEWKGGVEVAYDGTKEPPTSSDYF